MTKRIVVCCDGTWNTPDQKRHGVYSPTNVVKTARALLPVASDGVVQVLFYDQGVGTDLGLDRLTGGAFGVGLSKNVQDAYRFVVHNFSEGDELFFFGFSRGAYTARSTVGLIRKCGVLKQNSAHKIPTAYKLYRRRDIHPDDESMCLFRNQHSTETRIKLVGVWDTVGALGVPVRGLRFQTRRRYEFHDVQLSRSVENAFHALAIDERRRPFKPTLWATKEAPHQRVEQVWFVGTHSSVGGGYPEAGLSDCAFLWMMRRAEECGLAFDPAYVGMHVHEDFMGPIVESKTGLYRLTRDHIRKIGVNAGATGSKEAVHSYAVMRYEQAPPPYQPENLTAYLSGSNPRVANN